MQHERVGIRAQLGNDERDLPRHQIGNERHVTGQPVHDRMAANLLTQPNDWPGMGSRVVMEDRPVRNLAFWTAVGVALVGANGSVFAASLVPTDHNFKVRGGILVQGPNLKNGCPAHWQGRVDQKGVAKINSAVIESRRACQHTRLAGLPWGFKATGVGRVKISGVSFTYPGIVCGPSTINGRLSSGGEITFHAALAGDQCYIFTDGGSGGMQTYPPITTVP